MSTVLAHIQDMEQQLKELQILLKKCGSCHDCSLNEIVKTHDARCWKPICAVLDQLTTGIQRIKENIGSSKRTRQMQVSRRNQHSPASQVASIGLQQTTCPGRRRQLRRARYDTTESNQADGLSPTAGNKRADHQLILMPRLEPSHEEDNLAQSPNGPDQSHEASATAPIVTEPLGGKPTRSLRSRRPIVETQTQSHNTAQSLHEASCNHDIDIPYREEHGVFLLMPVNMEQCRDMPFILSQAEKLGARETGVFKYLLPCDFEIATHTIPSGKMRVSRFKSILKGDNTLHIARTEHFETLHTRPDRLTATEPDELADMLERSLTNAKATEKMQYCTDLPARTNENRRQLGLPAESPIWPLKQNLLESTRYIIPGLHSPYGYISGGDGSVFTIHVEDAELLSMNALYHGDVKLWNAVAPKHGHLVRNQIRDGKCAQKVRHASRWMPRSKLTAIGASFVTFVQHPREVVVVWGDTYHQGGTVGHAVAEAVNYGGPNWSIEGYSECSPDCDGFPIANSLLEFREPGERQLEQEDETAQNAHCSAQSEGVTRHAQLIQDLHRPHRVSKTLQKRKRGPSPPPQLKDKRIRTVENSMIVGMTAENDVCSTLVSQMVAALCSREAIKQFFDIVRGRRELEPTALRINCGTAPAEALTQPLQNDIQIIGQFSRKTSFHQYVMRLYQARLAQHAGDLMQNHYRLPKGGINKIIQGTGMSKRQYFHHRDRGVKWQQYRKVFPGILGFIPLLSQAPSLSSADWLAVNETDFHRLRRHLDPKYVSAFCTAGKLLEDSFDPAADDVDFAWENGSISVDKNSEMDLLSSLKPFPTTDDNIYVEDAYPNWPRPDDWPVDLGWPMDPTTLPPSADRQCDLCIQPQCDCANIRHEIQPRIRTYPGKGRGLQAVASEAGQVAYKKDAIIGFIKGEIAPPNTFRNGKCIAIVRSDLPFEPEVAQINCNEIGNVFRLMNCDCTPSAKFKGMRVTGKFRIAIIANQDIRDGEEITVRYGSGFWGREKCPCPKCKSRAITTTA